jgi:riboflavin kinase/FMN adenylyltransferase
MQHYWSFDDVQIQNAWLTIGSFDGVHLGHQEILRSLIAGAHAAGEPAVVISFHPHPAIVLGKRKDALYLTTPEQRADLLGELGVDLVIIQPFNLTVAGMSASEFLQLVNDHLHVKELWVGHDFALGKGREGNVERLRQLGAQFGYNLEVVPPFTLEGEVVSSSRIRGLLAGGNVSEAARLLGRPYHLSGMVVPGDGRGRTIGVPTANISVWPEQQLPKAGVYVCRAWVDGQRLGALTNVGTRPTFEPQSVSMRVEAHLLDFNSDLYGQHLDLEFMEWLRSEEKFPNVQALIDQMQVDILQGRHLLAVDEGIDRK